MITIPTLNQLYSGILADLQTQYGATISPFGKSVLRAIAAVQAGKLKLYYLAIGNLQKNIFVDTAEPELIGGTLERFGRVKLGRNPFPAVAAQYIIQVSGTIGAIIKAETTFKSDDDSLNPGMMFVLDNQFVLVTGYDQITVRALTSGTASKLSILDTLTATSPIALVNSSVTMVGSVIDPLDSEDIETYRKAVINSYRLSAQGGAAVDYRLWSQDAQGVAQVYPYAATGKQGEINLFVEAIIADSTDGKGTPPASLLVTVQSVVEFNPDTSLPLLERGRRPLSAWQVNYFAISVMSVDIVITGYQGLTATIQAQLLAAITAAINAIRPFVSAADVLANKNDILDINKVIGMIITSQPGALFTSVSIKINGVNVSTYNFINGNIPYLNSVTYN